jgi:hypothetical protein
VHETPSTLPRVHYAAYLACQSSWAYGILTMMTACIPVEEGDDDERKELSRARACRILP